MRLFGALLLSLLMHLSVIWLWPYHAAPHNTKIRNNLIFNVNVLSIKSPSIEKNPLLPLAYVKSFQKKTDSSPENAQANSSKKSDIDVFSTFLSTDNLERKALPISNIDISMFKDVFVSGFPVQLRLYINASGRVVKIVRRSSLEQDQQMVSRLESLLYEMTFIPARKDNLDVDSYQDIEFNFNAVMTTSPKADRVN